MSEVKRYEWDKYDACYVGMSGRPDVVLASDYDALAAREARAQERLAVAEKLLHATKLMLWGRTSHDIAIFLGPAERAALSEQP